MPTETTQQPPNHAGSGAGTATGTVPAARPAPASSAIVSPTGEQLGIPVTRGARGADGAPARVGPPARRLIAVCAWAALLGFLGVIIAIRGLFAILASHPPAWYEPALVILGLGGIALTVAAFLAVRQRYTPWGLLGLATAALIATLTVTIVAV